MRLAPWPLLAALPCALAFAAGCGASSGDTSIAAGESNYTSEAGADGSDGGSAEASVMNAPVDVAPFTIADVTPAKLRFSYDGAPPVDAAQTEWTTVRSGAERRFQIQGATPVPGGNRVLYVEFGRGQALIERGTYDCAQMEAVALVIGTDGEHRLTVVDGAAQRACKVIIEQERSGGVRRGRHRERNLRRRELASVDLHVVERHRRRRVR